MGDSLRIAFSQFGANLAARLNAAQPKQDRFQVVPRSDTVRANVKGFRVLNPPDFVVVDSDSPHVYFLEVKGSEPSSDIPLASFSGFLKDLEAFSSSELNPSVIFVTSSGVQAPMKDAFLRRGIHVIDGSSSPDVAADVANAILASEDEAYIPGLPAAGQ